MHHQAQTLTLLLIAERANTADLEYAAYRVIDQYLIDWPEAKKADLYSNLVEQFDPNGRLIELEKLVSHLIRETENNWALQ